MTNQTFKEGGDLTFSVIQIQTLKPVFKQIKRFALYEQEFPREVNKLTLVKDSNLRNK